MLSNLRLDDLPHAGILRNIALHHHEAIRENSIQTAWPP